MQCDIIIAVITPFVMLGVAFVWIYLTKPWESEDDEIYNDDEDS